MGSINSRTRYENKIRNGKEKLNGLLHEIFVFTVWHMVKKQDKKEKVPTRWVKQDDEKQDRITSLKN